MYTGRQIAIFTDVHGLLQPTIAILEDIRKRGITEIYSLGDNIGVGPDPSEVLDLLGEHGVISINGNSEEYSTIGIAPFESYFSTPKTLSQEWTESRLTSKQKKDLEKNKHSYDLTVGGLKIGLCHFFCKKLTPVNLKHWFYARVHLKNEKGKLHEKQHWTAHEKDKDSSV